MRNVNLTRATRVAALCLIGVAFCAWAALPFLSELVGAYPTLKRWSCAPLPAPEPERAP